MRLYSGTSEQFILDSIQNQIAEKLRTSFFNHFRYNPSTNEVRSWQNSLRALSQIFQYAGLNDHGVLLEYQLPMTSKRLDCMITDRDRDRDRDSKDQAVIVELKQWDRCDHSNGENEVTTWVGGALRDILHPSAQVGQYRMYLQDTHTAFYKGNSPVQLHACSYLHNYHCDNNDVLFDNKFSELLSNQPVFTADNVIQIKDYLSEKLQKGEGIDVLNKVEQSKYRPSKKLMDHVGNVIKGNPEYILLDEQKVAYDKVLAVAKEGFHNRKKTAIIVKGGPGTGKSVIAINLMSDLLLKEYNAHYATGSKAFTETLRKVIGRRGAVQFKYFNSYIQAEENEVDVLICDEAHRIRVSSNNRFTKADKRSDIKQIEELFHVAKVSVFFIDDDQVVRPNEIGSVKYIKECAEKNDANVLEFELEAQFRCSGSDAFVNWINNTLGIKQTANVIWQKADKAFDFKIFSSPHELENVIRGKENEGYSARMTAGFCWEWSKELNPDGTLKLDVVVGDYVRPWNARPDATRLAKDIPKASYWAYDPKGIDQVGCVYTAQGFEFDYVGVIIGKDLIYDLDDQQWIGNKSESFDTVVKRSGDKFLDLVKNTYRVLLTRGMKGCYVYFQDKDTERFFKSRME